MKSEKILGVAGVLAGEFQRIDGLGESQLSPKRLDSLTGFIGN